MSIVSDAIKLWHECRTDFEDYRLSAYEQASEACRGALLNARGRRAGVDSLSLFMGNWATAKAYASDELLEHWRTHTRPVYEDFERQWVAVREAEQHG